MSIYCGVNRNAIFKKDRALLRLKYSESGFNAILAASVQTSPLFGAFLTPSTNAEILDSPSSN